YYTYNRPDNAGANYRNRADYPENFDANYGQGSRTQWSKLLQNALIGKVEGFDNTTPFNGSVAKSGKSCALRAKKMLLDNVFTVANFGVTIGNGQPNPSIALWRRGY